MNLLITEKVVSSMEKVLFGGGGGFGVLFLLQVLGY